MALETTEFDVANYLTDPAEIAGYLEAEFEDFEPKFMILGLEAVIRARGSVAIVADETGISRNQLARLSELDDTTVRDTATKVMQAYRSKMESAIKVA